MTAAEALDETVDDDSNDDVIVAEPIGPAESQRRQLKQQTIEKIAAAKEALLETKKALKEAKAEVVRTGPQNMHLLSAAKQAIEHNAICVEHHQAQLAMIDRPELLELVEEWDSLFGHDQRATHGTLFLEQVASEVEQLNQAAKSFVEALAGMHRKFHESIKTVNRDGELAKELQRNGIRVKPSPPQQVVIQDVASGALRTAIIDAGLSLGDHWLKESLRPDHHVPRETLTRKSPFSQ